MFNPWVKQRIKTRKNGTNTTNRSMMSKREDRYVKE